MGLTASMNIARQALNVAQQGINIVSNNVANMNTEGYSKSFISKGSKNCI